MTSRFSSTDTHFREGNETAMASHKPRFVPITSNVPLLPKMTEESAPKKKQKASRREDTSSYRPLNETDREKVLVKSRAAATKSRRKRKMLEQELEDRLRTVQTVNMTLRQAMQGLHLELSSLQALCFNHVNCDCIQIRDHIWKYIGQSLSSDSDQESFVDFLPNWDATWGETIQY